MFEPIDEANLGTAIDFLCKGFPRQNRHFWETGINRILRFCDSESVGYFLKAYGRPVGIILTPQYKRLISKDRTTPIINLSSCYIEPEFGRCAPLMMKAVLSTRDDAIFTNVTPTPAVAKIMKSFGFQLLNNGVSLVCLPYHAGIG